jgi:hypothetical protein
MKKQSTSKALLAGAAIAGLIAAGVPTPTHAATNLGKTTAASAGVLAKEKGETHDCAGKNSCKGKGGCKTGDASCAGKNSCKGKGGCATKDGKPVKGQ